MNGKMAGVVEGEEGLKAEAVSAGKRKQQRKAERGAGGGEYMEKEEEGRWGMQEGNRYSSLRGREEMHVDVEREKKR